MNIKQFREQLESILERVEFLKDDIPVSLIIDDKVSSIEDMDMSGYSLSMVLGVYTPPEEE